MAKKDHSISVHAIMNALDRKDRGFYQNLTEQQQKDFSAWMMMRYASSVDGELSGMYIYLVNEIVNLEFSSVKKHPELQWLLFSAVGAGRCLKHQYIKPPNSRKKKSKQAEFVSQIYPELKTDEIELFLSLNSDQDLKQIAKDHGFTDKDIDTIFRK